MGDYGTLILVAAGLGLVAGSLFFLRWAGAVDLPWWAVTAPVWAPAVLFVAYFLIVGWVQTR